jgi:hypothetical protein
MVDSENNLGASFWKGIPTNTWFLKHVLSDSSVKNLDKTQSKSYIWEGQQLKPTRQVKQKCPGVADSDTLVIPGGFI